MIQDFPKKNFYAEKKVMGFFMEITLRDKDAISAALLACDLQSSQK